MERSDYSEEFVKKSSNQIQKLLFTLEEFQNALSIMFYASKDNEIFTHEMIRSALALGKRVSLPLVTDETEHVMIPVEINDFEDLKKGYRDIPEPLHSPELETDLESIDLVIVPGVIFDKHGCRVGYGAGYYDYFLKRLDQKTKRIGLSYECVDEIDSEAHDVCVDKIITPTEIIECRIGEEDE